jgi:mycofactocin precursor
MVVLSKPCSVNRRRAISSSSRRLVPGGRPRRPPAASAALLVDAALADAALADAALVDAALVDAVPVNTVCLLDKPCLWHKVTLTCHIYSSPRDGNGAAAFIVHVCAARESAMSELVATAEITENQAPAAEPELAEAELLVEEVSIDGMCGVY